MDLGFQLPISLIYAAAGIAVTAIASWQDKISLPDQQWAAGALCGVITIIGMRPDAIAGSGQGTFAGLLRESASAERS